MKLKILIKGALKKRDEELSLTEKAIFDKHFGGDYDQCKREFVAACKALGEAIVRAGHEIVVGVSSWEDLREGRTVASYVIEGANKVPARSGHKHKIVFYAPQDPEPPDTTAGILDTIREFNALDNIIIEERFLGRGNWSAAMIPDVEEADAVILLGGGDGTASIGYAAVSFNKAVVPISWFGGAAADISANILFNDYVRNRERYNIDASELRSLQSEWFAIEQADDSAEENKIEKKDTENERNAQSIVSLTQKLAKQIQTSTSEVIRVVRLTVALMMSFMFLWIAVYLRGNTVLSNDTIFFVLLFISSVVGTGLRTLIAYRDGVLSQLTPTQLMIDITLGLGVALAMALVYLIGGISFTGEVVVLNAQSSSTFSSIGVTMSLLGLAAGYLLPVNQLTERLESILADDKDVQEPASLILPEDAKPKPSIT